MATLFKGKANILKSFIYENFDEIVTFKDSCSRQGGVLKGQKDTNIQGQEQTAD